MRDKENRNTTTVERQFTTHFNSVGPWNVAPANVPDPAQMFSRFPIYFRPAMMLEAYRQIVGHATFFALQRALLTEYAYSPINEAQFIALAGRLARQRSGFTTSYLARLDEFFQQWLHGTRRPSLTPATFSKRSNHNLPFGINSTELEITWRHTDPGYFLQMSGHLNDRTWFQVEPSALVTNGVAKLIVPGSFGKSLFPFTKGVMSVKGRRRHAIRP